MIAKTAPRISLRSVAISHGMRHPAVIAALFGFLLTWTAAGAVFELIWKPAVRERQAAEARLSYAMAQLREAKYRIRLGQEYAERYKQVEELETKLGLIKSEPEFVRDIESLVTRSGATATQFSSHKTEHAGPVVTTVFEFFLTGSYANLRKFLAELPNLNEFVAIERISLEHSDELVRAHLILKRRQRPG